MYMYKLQEGHITQCLSWQRQCLNRRQLFFVGLNWTYHAHHFIFISHFNFLFVPCGRLNWLPVRLLINTLSYRVLLVCVLLTKWCTCQQCDVGVV